MGAEPNIRTAEPGEAPTLSALACRSKAHWGYPEEFMDACRDELTYPPEQVATGVFHVLEEEGEIRGFYALTKISPTALELEAMFVEPAQIGRGYGRVLMEHALTTARATADIERLVIQADPHAAAFYEAAGARLIGERLSASIPGRRLPLYEIELRNAP